MAVNVSVAEFNRTIANISAKTLFSGADVSLNLDNLDKIKGDITKLSFVDFMNILCSKSPIISITHNLSTLVYQKGDSIPTGIELSITVVKGSSNFRKIEVIKNGVTIHTLDSTAITNANTNSGVVFTVSDTDPISVDTKYDVVVTCTDNDSVTKSLEINFYDPYYYGVSNININDLSESNILIMTKDISQKSAKKYSFSTDLTNGEYCILAYPKEYGQLKSILDPNGFENLTSFNYTVMNINGVPYYVYQTGTKVFCSNFVYQFS